MAKRQTTVRIDKSTLAMLDEFTAREGGNRNAIINDALRTGLSVMQAENHLQKLSGILAYYDDHNMQSETQIIPVATIDGLVSVIEGQRIIGDVENQ